MSIKSKHNPYFDFLRGVAILMVVGIHTYPGGHSINGSVGEFVQLLLINIFNCAVPLFLAISGYFIARKKLDSLSDCASFWKKQIPVVYIPCLIFSVPWLAMYYISNDYISGGVILKGLAGYFLCGYSVYYFILLIIECYLLAPLLVKYNNRKTLALVVIISIISTGVMEYVRFILGKEMPLIVRGSFPILLLFFYTGIYLSKSKRDYSLLLPVIMMIIGIASGMLQMEWIRDQYGVSAQGQKITLYIFDIGFILLCMSHKVELLYRNNRLTRLILYIGEISFGIYFTHVYLILIANRFLPFVNGNWAFLWGVSLLLTIAAIALVKRIAPVWSRRYLGYR